MNEGFGYETYSANLRFRDPAEASVQVQVLPPRQQLVYGIKLRAVAHILVHIQDIGENTEEKHSSCLAFASNADTQLFIVCILPVSSYWRLPWCHICVSGQHFKGCGFTCTIYTKKPKALQNTMKLIPTLLFGH